MAWWNKKDGVDERLVTALERLVRLYEYDLAARGVFTYFGDEEGEVLETDEYRVLKNEAEAERKRELGLPDRHDFSLPGGGELLFGGSWSFPMGPEGAEEAQPGTQEAGNEGIGTTGPPPR